MKIGLLLVSTFKYDIFLQPIIDSLDRYFFRHHNVTIYLFTDKNDLKLVHSDRINIITIPIEHKPFPYATLYRYKYFTEASHLITTDHVFYSDVDMKFVGAVDREILGDIVSVKHPGFYKGGWGSGACDIKSLAYLPPEDRGVYMAGGFQGGSRDKYIEACSILSQRISEDEKNGVMAEWHDETHWNWFVKKIAKDIKVLDCGYCYPESWQIPYVKRILALDKDHKALRL